MGSGVGMRDGHANNLISTRCVNSARRIAVNIAKLPELLQHKT
jgi:hypothetical protein